MDAKPSDFEELKRLMLRLSGGDEKRSAARALSFSILWALAVGTKPAILADMVELLRFELERQAKEP